MTPGAVLSLSLAAFLSMTCACWRPEPVPLLPNQVTDFHQLFATNCSGCHGVNGRHGAGPRLNDPLYLALATPAALHDVIANGRPNTPMPAFATAEGGPLSDAQIDDLVNGMEREWARPVNLHGIPLPTYSVSGAPPGDAVRGDKVYKRQCFMCHGYGQHAGIMGLVGIPSFVSLASDQGLRTTVIVGRTDWGMPDWRFRIPGHPMSDQDISDVVAWLAAKRPAPIDSAAATPAQGKVK